MAPVAIAETPIPVFNKMRDGQALEETSDAVDEVNVLKANMKKEQEKGLYEESEFDKEKDKTAFRQYEDACDRVKNFYKEQHTKQTVAYNLKARHEFHSKTRAEMTVWEAMEKLNTLIDESDPDTSLSQIEHLLQSAEAIRRDGKPRWMQLTGLIHDLGKLLFFFDAQGQWDVVGDTFPVGCGFDERIIYGRDSFRENEDFEHPIYDTKFGIYSPGCGLDKVMLSWGHDEYLYHIAKEQSTLPDEALAMIRYHSFYPWHNAGAYHELMDDHDKEMLRAVKAFNPYDLYSKSDDIPSAEELKPYYMELINEYFPNKVVRW
ncbi:Inositol oxygenase 1 [Penicillium hispanicum]|uniref:Inositol oxygenase 1 n=1 Tax=Penicillium hispanicum TaxID=1080232 RepID=UPI00254147E8|nr:Inositol oxygenase 1 [Penicillium hispanicum]KAJ5569758.1 Inositol oxygenase 1 [Penicillium hispanicum]